MKENTLSKFPDIISAIESQSHELNKQFEIFNDLFFTKNVYYIVGVL